MSIYICVHIDRQTERIPIKHFLLWGLKTCKFVNIMKSISYTVTTLSHIHPPHTSFKINKETGNTHATLYKALQRAKHIVWDHESFYSEETDWVPGGPSIPCSGDGIVYFIRPIQNCAGITQLPKAIWFARVSVSEYMTSIFVSL
jgi:hypothetical protein